MIKEVYSVYDVKTKIYQLPFFAHNNPDAMRQFQEGCKNSKSMLAIYPNDFSLYHVGSFDDCKGSLEKISPLEYVCKADDFIDKGVSNGSDSNNKSPE